MLQPEYLTAKSRPEINAFGNISRICRKVIGDAAQSTANYGDCCSSVALLSQSRSRRQPSRDRTPEGRSPGSLAWAGLANTYFWIDPARDVSGVILMQVLPFADGKCLEAFAGFERGVYAGLDAAQKAA